MANSDSDANITKCTRSGGLITIDFEIEYPVINNFDKYKLPTHKEILGLVRKLNESKTYDQSITEVSNTVRKHWTDRNIYPITLKSVKRRVTNEKDVLAMQRGKYYDFGEYPKEYPVFDQCPNADNTPVNNLQIERQCGDTDHRLKKKFSMDAVTRGTVLKQTCNLRGSVPSGEFRKIFPVVQEIAEIKLEWNTKQKEANLLQVENRKLNILDKLKKQGGPFTSDEQIQTYLDNSKDPSKVKLNRMKDEVTYARDTCSSLPKSNPIFKIYNTQGRKRTMLTPEEFGNNLKILLGKTQQRHTVTLDDFREALAS